MKIEILDPTSVAAGELIALSDAYMAALYPAESNHLESVQALAQPQVIFLGCYVEENPEAKPVACGAVKMMKDDVRYGEIKRVFVLDAFRGLGLSKRLMQALENHLLANDIRIARLETGIHQPEALGLYQRLGYIERSSFGDYQEDPLSVFLEKNLLA
jgi:putative acetyltransferase